MILPGHMITQTRSSEGREMTDEIMAGRLQSMFQRLTAASTQNCLREEILSSQFIARNLFCMRHTGDEAPPGV